MADTLLIAHPIPLGRPRGAHRFEAFSPKLERRVMFYRRVSLEQWLLTPKSLEGRTSQHVRKLTIGILSGNRHLRRCQFKL
ncbi:hypothetical protein HDG35_006903 [Paraburkholderia sp. JPY681]|uniref:Uncharacterized protein n=1 Tax=Paraburkholderia atlantica TaxID=2654982 RepID=D5WP14_PARAM|nr:hypothetical protein BC1002_6810 [Paraburkholderia atlantica]MBB5510606.1 hypothetical protein [Paraburkholderia atlantica]